MAAGTLLATTTTQAQATPLATAAFSGNAASSIVAVNSLTVGATTIATASVAQGTASVGANTSTATASNLAAAVVGIPIAVNALVATSPPPASSSGNLVDVTAAPLVTAAGLFGSVNAAWPAVGSCPTAGAAVSTGSVLTAGATVGGLGAGLPALLSTGVATAASSTRLVSAAGPVGTDTRAVQVSATNSISTIDLLGGSSATSPGITITINSAPVLTGTATGVSGTSSVVYTPASATIAVAGGAPVALTAGLAVPINVALPGLISVTGSLTLNGAATGVTNTGTAVTGDAALLSLSLAAALTVPTFPPVPLASVSLDVAPMHVDATSPADGIQCPLPMPTTTGIDPDQGPTAGGQAVTITGTDFVPGSTTVTIGGITVAAADVTVDPAGTSLTFLTPPHAAGPVDVTVTTPGGTTTPPLAYTYIPPPTATGIDPDHGPTTGGQTVTITGTGFVPGATTVDIGGVTVPAADVTVDPGGTSLTFVTPPHAAGPVDVTVTTADGTTPPLTYTYVPPVVPTATAINPDHGPTSGGQTVTITGTGFVPGATTVTIGGAIIPAGSVTVAPGGTSLTFVTPPHTTGPVDVTVTTPGGTTPPLTYTYVPVAPVITCPANGSTTDSTPTVCGTGTPGDTVTVTEGGVTICTALVDSSGEWACVHATALACGSHTVTATQESPDGLVSAASNTVTFTVGCAGLASTGTAARGLLGLSMLLLFSGALTLVFARRRRTA